jgi:hypothetical protein
LWPQPWPAPPGTLASFTGFLFCDIPALASNSPNIPIIGLPEPYDAVKAVLMPATPSSTSKPFFLA